MRAAAGAVSLDQRVLGWLPLIYESVLNDEALERLMTEVGAEIGAEWSVPHEGGAPTLAVAHNMPGSSKEVFERHFHQLEPWPGLSKQACVPFGSPALSHEMIGEAAFRHSAYYQDLWRPESDGIEQLRLLEAALNQVVMLTRRLTCFTRGAGSSSAPTSSACCVSTEWQTALASTLSSRSSFR